MGTRLNHNRECDHCHQSSCFEGATLCPEARRELGGIPNMPKWTGALDWYIVAGCFLVAIGIVIGAVTGARP